MAYTYRINGGIVEVEQPDGSWLAPQPSQADIGLFHAHVERWAPEALDAERRYGVPAGLSLAIIESESGGNPDLGPTFDGGVGLMMITSAGLKAGHSTAELKDPVLNIDLGVGYLAKGMVSIGDDPAALASWFNAGSPDGKHAHASTRAPWGWREYELPSPPNPPGTFPYITRVVKLNNYIRGWLGQNTEIARRDSGGFWAVVKKSVPVMLVGMGIGIGVILARGRA